MKNFYKSAIHFIITFLLVNILISYYSYAQKWLLNIPEERLLNFYEIQNKFNEYWKDKIPGKGDGWKQFKRWEYFWEQRVYPTGLFPNTMQLYKEWNEYKEKKHFEKSLQGDYSWTLIGPNNIPQKSPALPPPGIGRMNCIAFHPTNYNVMWAGAAFGGIWKTENGGQDWQVMLNSEFMSIGITDIAVCKSNPNILYAATGDADAAGFMGQMFCFSIGIIKSIDGGNTWQPTNFKSNLNNRLLINRVLVNPDDPNIVYAATSDASNGVIKSTDGGNSWTTIVSEYCRDLEFKPNSTNEFLGAFNSNGNYTIKKFDANGQNKTTVLAANQISGTIRIALAVSNDKVYAVCCGNDNGFHSFWRSDDAGNTWTKTADKNSSPNYFSFWPDGSDAGGQGMYDLCLAINPKNSSEVFLGAVNVWKSKDGGKTFTLSTEWSGGYGYPWVHADHHSLEFSPNGTTLFSTNDGGINKTTNLGSSWTDISSNLKVTQFYKISTSQTDANMILGGSQDNGTHLLKSGTWRNIRGGDGMDCQIDPTNHNYLYTSVYNGSFSRSTDGGNTFYPMLDESMTGEQGGWVTPLVIDPNNPQILYTGYKNIWKSTNHGLNWNRVSNFSQNQIISNIAVAPSNSNVIYASSGNKLYVTFDGGTNWENTASTNVAITSIAVDPTNTQRAFITVSGYSANQKVYIFNYYTTPKLTNYSGSLPNIPVNCIVYQKNSPDRLYIGTDIGVFYRDNTTGDWLPFNEGLPNIVVSDLDIHYATGKLRAATFGRGIWETNINNCNLQPPTLKIIGDTSFCDGGSVVLEVLGNYSSYKWSSKETTKSITIKSSGEYYCVVTDESGCAAASRTVRVTVFNIPSLSIRATGTNPMCDGDSIQLKAGLGIGFASYKWSNGMEGSTIYVKEAGTYVVTGTTKDGCVAVSEPYEVKVTPKSSKPTITRNGNTLTSSQANTYQWYKDGSPITGATKQSYTTNEYGNYFVEVTKETNCPNRSDVVIITNINETNTFLDPTVLPNPTKDKLYIEMYSLDNINISINVTNTIGELLYNIDETVSGDMFKKEIEFNNYPSGIYYISIRSGNNFWTKKVIKIE